MSRFRSIFFGLSLLSCLGLASAGTWKVGGTGSGSPVGTITGLQYVSDANGDRIYVQFSSSTSASDYYVSRLADFGGDNERFNRLYSALLSIQATGQTVTDIFLSASGSTTFTGINLGNRF